DGEGLTPASLVSVRRGGTGDGDGAEDPVSAGTITDGEGAETETDTVGGAEVATRASGGSSTVAASIANDASCAGCVTLLYIRPPTITVPPMSTTAPRPMAPSTPALFPSKIVPPHDTPVPPWVGGLRPRGAGAPETMGMSV